MIYLHIIYIYKPLKFFSMEKIKLNGENWSSVVNSNLTEGAKLVFEDGFKCTVVEYYKAHFFKKGSKTALKIKVGNKVETIDTDRLRTEHCPDYVAKPHAKPTKKFVCEGIEFGTREELTKAYEAISEELTKRERENQKEEEKAKLLASLTPEQRELLGY